eukprot:5384829-Prymnesium_polylepis.1
MAIHTKRPNGQAWWGEGTSRSPNGQMVAVAPSAAPPLKRARDPRAQRRATSAACPRCACGLQRPVPGHLCGRFRAAHRGQWG